MKSPSRQLFSAAACLFLLAAAARAAVPDGSPRAQDNSRAAGQFNQYGNDFDGDGISDFGVFDGNTGNWYILSSSGTPLAWAQPWGWPGAIPVPGDYDGDRRADLAVFDGNTGNWYAWSLANGVLAWATPWGWPGAVPVSGDYDGDARSDLAVFDINTGNWYAWSLANGLLAWATPWGWPGAVPVSGDYDGDARSDLAVFDINTGNWYAMSPANGVLAWATPWGWPGARPVSGDFDGDARADLAIFDGITGHWYVTSLTNGVITWDRLWGWSGAIPIGMPVLLVMSGTAALSVHASPTNGGTVAGGGTYPVGLRVEITATANTNWAFTGWNDGGTQAVRTVPVPFGGAEYTASFTQKTATLSVIASPTNGGTVTGGGTYPVGTQVVITAAANSGWVFTGWNDGDAAPERTVTVPATGAVFIAAFAQAGVITLSASPAEGGVVAGGGTYAIGSQVEITAAANTGWTFTAWNDGVIQAVRTVTVAAGVAAYTAYFTESGAARLALVGHVSTAGARGVALYGGRFACVADGTNGWFIINIANPAAPGIVSHTPLSGACNDIAVYGNYAYVSTTGTWNEGLAVFDIGVPEYPSKVKTIAGQYNGLEAQGSLLYAGIKTPTFKVFNMDSPFLLVQLGQLNSAYSGMRFALSNGYAYVATRSADVLVLDVSTPSNPLLGATYATGHAAMDVALSGDTLCVAAGTNGLELVDVSSPFSPLLAGRYHYAGISCRCVATSGSRCYLGSPDGDSRMLEIVNIVNPSAPARMDHVTTGGYARDLAVGGQYLYVAEEPAAPGSAGLTIYRIE